MKRNISVLLIALLLITTFSGCGNDPKVMEFSYDNAVSIILSDDGITADGENVTYENTGGLYVANDIVYYPKGTDFTFGEGTESDMHSAEEAAKHTVLHITSPGSYILSGKLSFGQIAVDLGEDAKSDPSAVVNLILDGADINCSVAPAVIFYNVYECSSSEAEGATKDVDTAPAGANVLIKDKNVNNITGSHVAKIYRSVELNDDKTEVIDSKKLHKYDAAFYSKMTMNIYGEKENTGVLNITADNEGLDSELHLTINGGIINITSGNDGINTNEDYVSVTTINGGEVNITVTGSTGEGDGIDSNGWLVINGGKVTSFACGTSGDSGIDSDMGIYLNGGTVIATGNMLDRIAGTGSRYAVFSFASRQSKGSTYTLRDEDGKSIMEITPRNDFSNLIISSDSLKEGTYNLYMGDTPLAHSSGQGMRDFGGRFPAGGNIKRPELPEGEKIPTDGERPELPEGFERPDKTERPEGMMPEDGTRPDNKDFAENGIFGTEQNKDFEIRNGANSFSGIAVYLIAESV